LAKLPIIDLAGFPGDPVSFERVVAEMAAAARGIGFFYLVNHGVPRELMEGAFAESKAFFARSYAKKCEIAIDKVGGNRGYSALLQEALDPTVGADLKEAFNIGLNLSPDDPELLAGVPFRALNAWPAAPSFRETLVAYFDACSSLAEALHRAFARDLSLPLDFFQDKLDKPMATLRILHYPSTPEGEIGAGEHTDYGNITLLATDDVGGLEVRTRAGEWIMAPPILGAFVVNIGDCLMRWTNDVYVSTPHRVVNRSERERYSIAFFFDPNPDALVEGIPSYGEPRYAPVRAADYLKIRLDASVPTRIDQVQEGLRDLFTTI
jgi:isopenicillin N synthase-like dioxygenase